MPPLDAVILLAGHQAARAIASDQDAVFFGVNLDLIAVKTRDFRHEDVVAGCLVQVDRRIPPRSISPDELPDLLMQREEIAERIPPGKGHDRIVA